MTEVDILKQRIEALEFQIRVEGAANARDIRHLESKVRMYEVQHDLESGIVYGQALSTMDGYPAPESWKEISCIAKARPLGHDDYVSLQRLEGAPNICVWMTKRSHLWTIASEFFRIDAF